MKLGQRTTRAVEAVYDLIDRAPFVGKNSIQPALQAAYGTYDLKERRAAQEKAISTIKSMRSMNMLTVVATTPMLLSAHTGQFGEAALAFQVLYAGAHAACVARQSALIDRLQKRMQREEAHPPVWNQAQPPRTPVEMTRNERNLSMAVTMGAAVALVASSMI
ncbi:MAG: hypothetical protein ACAI38_03220 [Myxococcota bacterium]|nr:hypothetical protein [Myxococcota bacterium]